MFTNAHAYDRFMGRWSRLVAPLLIEFAKLPESGQILDVGCGIGSLAFTIARLRPHCNVLGIDASSDYIGYAKSQIRSSSRRIQLKVGDAQNLPFPDAMFDSSLSLLVLNFIPDARRAVYQMTRVTRPRGRVVAAVWDYGGRMEMLRIFWDAAVALDTDAERFDERKMPLCHEGELSALWRSAGLYDISEHPLEVKMNFKSFPDYWDPFLLGQGPAGAYVRRIGKDRSLMTLREDLRERLGLQDETTPFTLHGQVWAVRGSVPESK
ncbi:methylase involved in ubiquinone/menaquinone biosynthesis [Candidatus Nitrososphaera evergladensis SR1]|uniref:Methylase involved in ubiquinone/menaquinone biosynthesis n=1 Tax=Candidatus Nitrososphaera evergladensis SR1 TaxID=1459636 RepID=A0A075MM38_9ARCH|nr:methyltransferase domain-containing protein [Candidatus Nitrososphaera evergladensis]AIF82313.1 methylase involved in ubiquinone/menaquinone biosynthesis [Candidatus Nitrososphaera evergladensis SR1]